MGIGGASTKMNLAALVLVAGACALTRAESACDRFDEGEAAMDAAARGTAFADTARTGHHAVEPLRSTPELVSDSFAMGVTVAGETVFLSSGKSVCALHRGQTLMWKAHPGRTQHGAVVDGVFYVPGAADDSTFITALDAGTGDEVWRWTQPSNEGARDVTDVSYVSSPVVAEGLVIFSSSSGLFALSVSDGSEVWSNAFAVSSASPGLPAYRDGTVYVYGSSGLYAIVAATGDIRWLTDRAPVTTFGFGGPALPVATEESVLLASPSGLRAYGADDGRELWEHAPGDPAFPAYSDGTVYAAGPDLTALDAHTGEVLWRRAAPEDGAFSGIPVLAGDVIYTSTSAEIMAFDAATGDPIWTLDLIAERELIEVGPEETLSPFAPVDIDVASAVLVPADHRLYVLAENPDHDKKGAGLYVLGPP